MRVSITEDFKAIFKTLSRNDQLKVSKFIQHVKTHGMKNLAGRNKSSDHVPSSNPQWLARARYAQKNNLWHYHIGIPNYVGNKYGDLTSQYIVHYVKQDGFIRLVDLSTHPPFQLPSINKLQSTDISSLSDSD